MPEPKRKSREETVKEKPKPPEDEEFSSFLESLRKAASDPSGSAEPSESSEYESEEE
jgi:non-homologous end joining protein Ku